MHSSLPTRVACDELVLLKTMGYSSSIAVAGSFLPGHTRLSRRYRCPSHRTCATVMSGPRAAACLKLPGGRVAVKLLCRCRAGLHMPAQDCVRALLRCCHREAP